MNSRHRRETRGATEYFTRPARRREARGKEDGPAGGGEAAAGPGAALHILLLCEKPDTKEDHRAGKSPVQQSSFSVLGVHQVEKWGKGVNLDPSALAPGPVDSVAYWFRSQTWHKIFRTQTYSTCTVLVLLTKTHPSC